MISNQLFSYFNKSKLYKFSFYIILFALSNTVFSQNKTVDNIVALVNDQMILLSDIRFQKLKERDTNPNNECNILKNLIINKLLFSKAEKDSLLVSEEELNGEMDRRMDYFVNVFGSQDKLEKYYNKTLTELKVSFRDEVKQQMMSERAKGKLLSGMIPSPKDVKEYYNKISPDSMPYYNTEYQMAQIVFLPKVTREAKRNSKLKAESIREKLIKKEADFATQAILYSDDAYSAAEGGNMNWINPGEMVPEFEQASFSLPIGKISDVVETQYGYHIIEVLDRKNQKAKVRHILISAKPDADAMEKAKLLADSIQIKIAENRLSFEKAVELYSDDKMFKSFGGVLLNVKSRNHSPIFEIKDVDPQLLPIISNMKVGDLSVPMPYSTMDRKVGYRIVKLVAETPPHKASLETDYFKLKEQTHFNLKEKALTNWLDFYKNYAFIKLDPKFGSCIDLYNLSSKN